MPAGKKLDDGFKITVGLAAAPNISLWEKEVTPPGAEGGGANDTTTMRNNSLRTRSPKKLITLSEMSVTAAYDPQFYNTFISQINVNQVVTVNFPDGSHITFYGWLDSVKPGAVKEGEQPTAACTIIPSNQDNTGAESLPTYTAPP